jgi:hypothetical protein
MWFFVLLLIVKNELQSAINQAVAAPKRLWVAKRGEKSVPLSEVQPVLS